MHIEKIINSIFTSNTYILSKQDEKEVWLIDPGDSNQIIDWLENSEKQLIGIFLTHSHFDHIYGLNKIQEKYPTVVVYASIYAKEGMMSEKLNGSYYQETPFTVKRTEIQHIRENDSIQLWKRVFLNVFETPGHDRDCLTFKLENNLFTGDALIPGVRVFTKLKYSNKTQAENSIKRILEGFDDEIIIWPGHGNKCLLASLKHGVFGNLAK